MLDVFNVTASGMEAQRLRMNVISSNLANAQTTRSPDGAPYRRKDVVFSAEPASGGFGAHLKSVMDGYSTGVKIEGVVEDPRPFNYAYEPNHPDADTTGYVAYPNVNVVEEMTNMIAAARSFEANVTAFKAARNMAMKALEIGA